jgi:hypothetical protein
MGRLGEYSLVLPDQLLFLLFKVRFGKLFFFKQSTDLPPEHVTRGSENAFTDRYDTFKDERSALDDPLVKGTILFIHSLLIETCASSCAAARNNFIRIVRRTAQTKKGATMS